MGSDGYKSRSLEARDRDRDRQTVGQRQTDREEGKEGGTDRQTKTETDREEEREGGIDRQADRQTETERESDRDKTLNKCPSRTLVNS